jgi:F0F1-type ATP synthase membrane subunit b/b'
VETLIAPAINLTLLLVVLAYYLVGPLKAFASARRGTIAEELERSRHALSSAREKFDDFDSRLRGLGAELETLLSQSAEEARRSRARLVQSANQLASTIVADAQAAASGMRDELIGQLRTEIAVRAIARAEEQIRARLTGEERVRLRKEFSALMEKAR